jgi:excisionase family DNA binding protein
VEGPRCVAVIWGWPFPVRRARGGIAAGRSALHEAAGRPAQDGPRSRGGQFRHLSVHRAEAHGQSRPSFSRLRGRSAPERVSEPALTAEHSRLHDDDVVTVADAAQIAQRSIRTIRRAYMSGKLLAHRDGNGRGVRIRYADLRAWLLAQPIRPAREQPASRPVARINVRKRPEGGAKTENLELLTVARERRGRAARVSGAGRPAGVRPPPRPA